MSPVIVDIFCNVSLIFTILNPQKNRSNWQVHLFFQNFKKLVLLRNSSLGTNYWNIRFKQYITLEYYPYAMCWVLLSWRVHLAVFGRPTNSAHVKTWFEIFQNSNWNGIFLYVALNCHGQTDKLPKYPRYRTPFLNSVPFYVSVNNRYGGLVFCVCFILCYISPSYVIYVISVCLHMHMDQNGWTALHWAAYQGNDECIRLLLATGADFNLCGNVCTMSVCGGKIKYS